jgi:hypothetical protein
VAQFGGRERHPTIRNLIAIFKRQHPTDSLDWFYEQWFDRITIPDFQVAATSVRPEGAEYVVEFTAANLGEGKMLVSVEAMAGDGSSESDLRAAAIRLWVEPGKEAKGAIRCAFRPQRLILDRTREVIDSDRSNNEFRF